MHIRYIVTGRRCRDTRSERGHTPSLACDRQRPDDKGYARLFDKRQAACDAVGLGMGEAAQLLEKPRRSLPRQARARDTPGWMVTAQEGGGGRESESRKGQERERRRRDCKTVRIGGQSLTYKNETSSTQRTPMADRP